MMTRLNMTRFFTLVSVASLSACAVTQPPAPVSAPPPQAVFVPQPAVIAPEPAPAPPPPVYTAPDYTSLEGHSSYTTPVPVAPVDVEEMGPVIGE